MLLSEKGPYYVGSTTDPSRRVRQHNGELKGGAKCTRANRPWRVVKVYGPYENRSSAFKAEISLKRGKRGEGRIRWTPSDSPHCKITEDSERMTEEFNGLRHTPVLGGESS